MKTVELFNHKLTKIIFLKHQSIIDMFGFKHEYGNLKSLRQIFKFQKCATPVYNLDIAFGLEIQSKHWQLFVDFGEKGFVQSFK